MVEHINRVFRVGRKGYVIEIYPDCATHSPNSKYTIRIRRVYSDTQSFRLFLPPWKRGSISRIRLINERHKLAGLDGFSRETKRSVDLEEEFAGSRRFFARRKQRSSWFFPWIVACPQPPPVSPFSHRFFRSWLQTTTASSPGKKHDLYRISEDSF